MLTECLRADLHYVFNLPSLKRRVLKARLPLFQSDID